MADLDSKDPSGVKALLETLRSSQAWQEVINDPNPKPVHNLPPSSSSPATSNSVASLLSQLQSESTSVPPQLPPAPLAHVPSGLQVGHVETRTPHIRRLQDRDIKTLTYQQSLPLLAQLSEDTRFVETITEV